MLCSALPRVLTAAVTLFWLLFGYYCCSRQIQRKNWMQVSIFFNFKVNNILYYSINEATDRISIYFFTFTYVFSLLSNNLTITSYNRGCAFPTQYLRSRLCLNVGLALNFIFYFFWTTSSVCYSVVLAIDTLTFHTGHVFTHFFQGHRFCSITPLSATSFTS